MRVCVKCEKIKIKWESIFERITASVITKARLSVKLVVYFCVE